MSNPYKCSLIKETDDYEIWQYECGTKTKLKKMLCISGPEEGNYKTEYSAPSYLRFNPSATRHMYDNKWHYTKCVLICPSVLFEGK